MPDGSAHLLLHIDDTECIDLNLIRGRYKYRLKRIGGLDGFECPFRAQPSSRILEKAIDDDSSKNEGLLNQGDSIGKSTVSAAIQKFQDAAKANSTDVKKKPNNAEERVPSETRGNNQLF